MLTQLAKIKISDKPVYKQKATQLSLIQRNMLKKPEKRKPEKKGWSRPDRTQHKC